MVLLQSLKYSISFISFKYLWSCRKKTMIRTSKDRKKKVDVSVQNLPEKALENLPHRKITNRNEAIRIKVVDKENYFEISTEVFTLLQKILDLMASGKSISIVPTDESLTTQQVARVLNMSRPHIIKLLESGEIPFYMVGTHRRVSLKDLKDYEKKIAKKREKKLKFLTKQAQNLDMGY